MKTRQISVSLTAIAMALALAGCGGGGGASDGVTSTSGTSIGTITGFGSIFVNGIEYETPNSADINLDNEDGDSSDLRVGMVVTVTGSVNDDGMTGVADSVEYDDELEGIVISNSIAPGARTGKLDIMGQQVMVTATTVFESNVGGIISVDQIATGNVVEVSGFADGTGNIEATRIEVKAATLSEYLASHDAIEVKGMINDLDTVAFTFELGELTVDYSGASLPQDGLTNDMYVEVKSTSGIDVGTGNLIASEVELEDDGKYGYEGDEGEQLEIKGTISSDFDGLSFQINGTTVLVVDATEFEHIKAVDLLKGTRIEAEGEFNAEGELVADEIKALDEDEHENDVDEIEGMVASVVLDGMNTGTITMMDGNVIHVTNETIMEDDRNEGIMPDEQFNLSGIGNSDYIEAYVYPDPDELGNWVAIKITREDESISEDPPV